MYYLNVSQKRVSIWNSGAVAALLKLRRSRKALSPHVGPRLFMKIQRGFNKRSPKLRPVRISNLN